MAAPRLLATPLAAWERDGLKAALAKTGLPADDVGDAELLFWRFESLNDVPVGFGGLEIHGRDALLRSVVILPRLREIGMGRAIVDDARERGGRPPVPGDLSPDHLAGGVLCAPRLCALRAPRRAGRHSREQPVHHALPRDCGCDDQARGLIGPPC